jgi:energy-coupling factor transporter ATP-binding protein EcfA2
MNQKDIKALGSSLDFWGYDIFGSFVNYAFRANKNPHSFIVAPSGSGKSFTLLKMISQIIRFDIKREAAQKIDENLVRFFDVGFTGLKFVKTLQNFYGNEKVGVLESKLNDVKFSLLDMKLTSDGIPRNDEYIYMLSMMDIILETNKEEPLTGLERQEVMGAVNALFSTGDHEYLTVAKLRDLGYDTSELTALGYSDFDKTNKIKEEKFNKYKVPMLSDLIHELDKRYRDSTTSESRKQILEKLTLKIKVIDSIGFFSYFNKTKLDFKSFYYMDFQYIKSDAKVFVAIFWFFLNTLYRQDVEDAMNAREQGKEPQNKYYIIEEAHNFLKLKTFQALFEVMSREARKYRIHLMFVTQDLDDIPKPIMNNIATKMLIYPRQQKDIDRMANQIQNIFSTNSKDMEEVFKKLERFTMLIDSDLGTFGFKFDVSDEELALFTLN